ncbi:MAG TPA: FtsX-like permease family protein [Puia sp.]|nr:FtsX-like permease family protein [Puia sp.]
MLKNYFKIAIAVLKRRKFFTFISLFGISFTLTILMVLAAFIHKVVGDDYPDTKRSRSLFVTELQETGMSQGGMSSASGAPSYWFLNKYAATLKSPEKVTLFSSSRGTNTYVNNKKIALYYKYTDATYWDVLDYEFLEGKPFTAQQVLNGEPVTVISDDIRKEYFGSEGSVVGKYIEADNVRYRVCGVVKSFPIISYMLYSDIYLPFTVSKTSYNDRSYRGNYNAILLGRSSGDLERMHDEFESVVKKLPTSDKVYQNLYCHAKTYLEAYADMGNEGKSGVNFAIIVVSIFTLIVMLLPTLNLININITRIMERSSEIGVRKAFGASSSTLAYQFIVENIILTLLGGLIACVFSFIIMKLLNSSGLIHHLDLSLNWFVLLIGLGIALVFGLLSGVYPAWRMSKLHVVTALREQ